MSSINKAEQLSATVIPVLAGIQKISNRLQKIRARARARVLSRARIMSVRAWAFLPFAFFLLLNVPVRAADKVAYRLKWLINMSTVGDVVAEQQEYFKAQGLDVTLKPGGPEGDALRELELGYAQFGVASADQIIQALAKGSPVVVIAQLFQVNPQQWIYFKDRFHVDSAEDLKGRTIGVTFGKNDEIIMRALLARAGIPEKAVRLYGVRMDYTPFYRKKVDLWPVYSNTQAVEIARKLKNAGEATGFLDPRDFGIRFVANSVITSKRLMAEKPELVNRFLQALIDGWRFAVDPSNTQAVIAAVRKYDRDTPADLLSAQLQATRSLVQAKEGGAIGRIDTVGWKQTEEIMLTYHLIDFPVNIIQHLEQR